MFRIVVTNGGSFETSLESLSCSIGDKQFYEIFETKNNEEVFLGIINDRMKLFFLIKFLERVIESNSEFLHIFKYIESVFLLKKFYNETDSFLFTRDYPFSRKLLFDDQLDSAISCCYIMLRDIKLGVTSGNYFAQGCYILKAIASNHEPDKESYYSYHEEGIIQGKFIIDFLKSNDYLFML